MVYEFGSIFLDAEDIALSWVEFQKPISLPLFQSSQIFLMSVAVVNGANG